MITPNDLSSFDERTIFDEQTINDIIAKIDAEIIENRSWYSMYDFAILDTEYPKQLRDKIAQMYRDSGWAFVEHQTSSEAGERPGLTEFRFSENPIGW